MQGAPAMRAVAAGTAELQRTVIQGVFHTPTSSKCLAKLFKQRFIRGRAVKCPKSSTQIGVTGQKEAFCLRNLSVFDLSPMRH